MQTRTFLQTLSAVIIITAWIFVLWLVAKNVTKQEVRFFLIGSLIFTTVIALVILIISLSTWNFRNVSKTIHEIGQTYFENFTIMLTKIGENSNNNNKNPIIIHNTGTSTQTTPLIPDQKTAIASNSQSRRPKLEYITLKELSPNENKQIDSKFFEEENN